MANRPDDAVTPLPVVEVDARFGIDRSHQLVAEMERLAHNLNVHLDEVETLIAERKRLA